MTMNAARKTRFLSSAWCVAPPGPGPPRPAKDCEHFSKLQTVNRRSHVTGNTGQDVWQVNNDQLREDAAFLAEQWSNRRSVKELLGRLGTNDAKVTGADE